MPRFQRAKAWMLLLGVIFFISCRGVPKETPPELSWPFPPEKPRIKFLDLIVGSADVVGVRTSWFKHWLFGAEPEVGFKKPSFVTVRDDVMYVTDVGAIHVYDFKRKKFKLLGRGVLNNATGIAVSSDGRIYVGDSVKKQVFIFNEAKAKVDNLAPAGRFDTPAGLAIDDVNGRLIVADAKKHEISVWRLDGDLLFSFGKRGSEFGEFNIPYSVAVDREGRIYVSDSGNFRVQIFDKDGNFLAAFGGVGTAVGHFSRPKGIALDSEGHIYVLDSNFSNFQIFGIDGSVFLAVGTNGMEAGKFILPSDIFIDGNDKIYVVDQLNRRIQTFQYIKYYDY